MRAYDGEGDGRATTSEVRVRRVSVRRLDGEQRRDKREERTSCCTPSPSIPHSRCATFNPATSSCTALVFAETCLDICSAASRARSGSWKS